MAKLGNPAAVSVFVTGLYMTWAQFSFSQGWIIVSLVLFVVAGGIAGGVLDPALKTLVAASDEAPDGPVSDDLRALATAPRMHNFEAVLFGVDPAIVFLMVNKPPLLPALLVTVAGLAIGVLRINVSGRHHAQPAVAG